MRIQKLGSQVISVFYFDGGPLEEKKEIHDEREQRRAKALVSVDKAVQHFADRVDNNSRIRKQHFFNVNKQLTNTFRWDHPVDRHSLAMYCRDRDWNVTESDIKADVRIAQDCILGDINISGDSDLAIHSTTTGIWRPKSGDKFLERQTPLRPDTTATTLARNLDFPLSDISAALTFEDVKTRFEEVKMRYAECKKSEKEASLLNKSVSPGSRVYRQKAGQQFNHYRTIDRPPPKDKKQTTNGASSKNKEITIDKSAEVPTAPQTQRHLGLNGLGTGSRHEVGKLLMNHRRP
ncbi:hypothetical protein BGZ47_002062 [Haplosporangium gracile]|nr:hypothetical protein BGZ47_002062 [Haplosporangium gracile]